MFLNEYDEQKAKKALTEEGVAEGRLYELFDLVNDQVIPLSTATKRTHLTEDDFKEKLENYNSN